MKTIKGRARYQDGTPVAVVTLYPWRQPERPTHITPAADGGWERTVPFGDYGVLYLTPGCPPIVHGPYTVLPE
jgi:hypothetical protein